MEDLRVVLSTSNVKSVYAHWLITAVDHLIGRKDLLLRGFRGMGIRSAGP